MEELFVNISYYAIYTALYAVTGIVGISVAYPRALTSSLSPRTHWIVVLGLTGIVGLGYRNPLLLLGLTFVYGLLIRREDKTKRAALQNEPQQEPPDQV